MNLYGWKKDPYDPRAVSYASLPQIKRLLKKVEGIPSERDMKKFLPPNVPWNQLGKGHCVGFGEGMNLTMRAVEQKVYDKIKQRFSPEWIVDGAQELEGSTGHDYGCYPTDGWLWLMQHGCLLESFYPYTEKVLKKKPSTLGLDKEALKWPMGSNFIRVDDGIDGIKLSLAAWNPISIGTPWFKKWEDIGKDGILPKVTSRDEIAGGHETIIFGYLTIKNIEYVEGINSWGDWADNGLFRIPATAFAVMKKIPAEQGGQYDAQFPLINWRP